jgi:hypothetical protein
MAAIWLAADVALVRNSPGGRELSDELVLLLVLAFFDDYLLFPSAAERETRGLADPSLARPTTRSTVATRIESGAGELVARMDVRAEHTECQHAPGHGHSDNYGRAAALETYESVSTGAQFMTDDELIERARKDVPESARKARYANCDPHVNHNWDLTRALLRRIDRLEGQLRWSKRKNLILYGVLGGAAAEGAKVAVLALIHALVHTAG